MKNYRILSTKLLEPALVEQARQKGIDLIEKELISVKTVWSEEIAREVALYGSGEKNIPVVVTSSNAVKALDAYRRRYQISGMAEWVVYCLSGKTRTTLTQLLIRDGTRIADTADNARDLAQKIIAHGVKEIAFFCGSRRRDELPSLLKKAGVTVHEVTVYETEETPVPCTADIDGILFFSPTAVKSFFSANQLNGSVVCFAVGRTTADSISAFTGNRVIVSPSPVQEDMLALVQSYFKQLNGYE